MRRKRPIEGEKAYPIYTEACNLWRFSNKDRVEVVAWFNDEMLKLNPEWPGVSLGLWQNWMNTGVVPVHRLYMPHIEIKESRKPRYNRPPKVKRDEEGYFVFCDAHCPYHDGQFLSDCANLALAWGIKTAICAGDFFDVTAFATAAFTVRPTEIFAEELSEGHKMVKAIADEMSLLLLTGNHEKRFRKYMREQLFAEHFRLLLKAPENVAFSDYGHTVLENSWLIGHPRSYSRIAARNPTFISRTWNKHHIVVGHSHNNAMTPAEDGQRVLIDLGMVGEPLKLDWVSMDISNKPMMQKGALILKRSNGRLIPYLLSPLWTDFEAMRRLYGKE